MWPQLLLGHDYPSSAEFCVCCNSVGRPSITAHVIALWRAWTGLHTRRDITLLRLRIHPTAKTNCTSTAPSRPSSFLFLLRHHQHDDAAGAQSRHIPKPETTLELLDDKSRLSDRDRKVDSETRKSTLQLSVEYRLQVSIILMV